MGQVLLVRHGQASWGAADYDVLSPLGERQAAGVGAFLADVPVRVVVHGAMRRQRETAELLVQAAGWDVAPSSTSGGTRWTTRGCSTPTHPSSTVSWTRGSSRPGSRRPPPAGCPATTTDDYAEPWIPFRDRVLAGFEALGDGTTVVVTSAGPVSVVVAHLLESPAAYRRIAPVVVNAAVTKVVVGRRGHTLVSFNEHGHLSGDLLTYR